MWGDLAHRGLSGPSETSLPRKSHYCQDCHDLRTIGKGDGIQMGLQAVQQTLSGAPPVISRPGMSLLRPGRLKRRKPSLA